MHTAIFRRAAIVGQFLPSLVFSFFRSNGTMDFLEESLGPDALSDGMVGAVRGGEGRGHILIIDQRAIQNVRPGKSFRHRVAHPHCQTLRFLYKRISNDPVCASFSEPYVPGGAAFHDARTSHAIGQSAARVLRGDGATGADGARSAARPSLVAQAAHARVCKARSHAYFDAVIS